MKISLELTYRKETPGTHVYGTDSPDAAVKSVYISKASSFFQSKPPTGITLTIEAK